MGRFLKLATKIGIREYTKGNISYKEYLKYIKPEAPRRRRKK